MLILRCGNGLFRLGERMLTGMFHHGIAPTDNNGSEELLKDGRHRVANTHGGIGFSCKSRFRHPLGEFGETTCSHFAQQTRAHIATIIACAPMPIADDSNGMVGCRLAERVILTGFVGSFMTLPLTATIETCYFSPNRHRMQWKLERKPLRHRQCCQLPI